MNKIILVTAFEPFGGLDKNSSQMIAKRLKPKYGNMSVSAVILPVLYNKAFEILKKAMDDIKPAAVICMGQAGGRKKISIERIAVNINDSSSGDNDETVKSDELIISDGPKAYFTNLPYREMMDAAQESVVISYSAGTYICNDVFYRLMNYTDISESGIKSGFIHLPYTEHFGKMPYIDLDRQIKAVEAMLTVIGDKDEKNEH